MRETLGLAGLEVPDRGERTGGQRRRKRRREDEARGEGPHEIAQRGGAGDIAAHHAEGLGKRALDDRQAVHQAFALGNAAAARAVHADGMDLVQIGHRAVLVGKVADFLDGGDVAVHRIDRFEGDQLRRLGIGGRQLGFEVLQVIVLPDHPLAFRMADALDHRSVVPGIGETDEAGNLRTERAERGPVGHIARGEKQGRFLAVQIGEFLFEKHMVVVGAGDVAGAAGTGATLVDGKLHRLRDRGILAHAEIIVGTPDCDVLRAVCRVAGRPGEVALLALQVGENAVAAFLMQAAQFVLEESLEVHPQSPVRREPGHHRRWLSFNRLHPALLRRNEIRCGKSAPPLNHSNLS